MFHGVDKAENFQCPSIKLFGDKDLIRDSQSLPSSIKTILSLNYAPSDLSFSITAHLLSRGVASSPTGCSPRLVIEAALARTSAISHKLPLESFAEDLSNKVSTANFLRQRRLTETHSGHNNPSGDPPVLGRERLDYRKTHNGTEIAGASF